MRQAPPPTSIRFPPELKRRLKLYAIERRQAVSSMVVWILEQTLAKWDQDKRKPK